MKHLIIIGARGYGRIACDIARNMPGYGSEFDIKGYLDDKNDALDGFYDYPKIIDTVENYHAKKDDVFVCALGDVKAKEKYIDILNKQEIEWFTIIHPSAMINHNAKIGKGCIISQGALLDVDSELGDFVCVQCYALVGHDVKIGKYCMIDSLCFLGGGDVIEDSVTLHTRSTVAPKITIGKNSVINACSLIIRNVKSSCVMMGNPAKEIFVPHV